MQMCPYCDKVYDESEYSKSDLIYQHYYHTEEELYMAVEEFAYVQYNHVRPHSYNNYKSSYEARYGGKCSPLGKSQVIMLQKCLTRTVAAG